MLLYHHPLSPFCRLVRLQLQEKNLSHQLQEERPWEARAEFLALAAEADVPLLQIDDGAVLVGAAAITEYLEETAAALNLLGKDVLLRAEVRRLCAWFGQKFYAEVTARIAGEKIFRRLRGAGAPDGASLRAGNAALAQHLDYVGRLAAQRGFLAGEAISLADLAGAAQISVLDYVGAVPWDGFEDAKIWYMRLKSRPSFRLLLADHLAALPPAAHYAALDF